MVEAPTRTEDRQANDSFGGQVSGSGDLVEDFCARTLSVAKYFCFCLNTAAWWDAIKTIVV